MSPRWIVTFFDAEDRMRFRAFWRGAAARRFVLRCGGPLVLLEHGYREWELVDGRLVGRFSIKRKPGRRICRSRNWRGWGF